MNPGTGRGAPNDPSWDADPRDVEGFLIRYVRANPGRRFGAITEATQLACHVSYRTAAWHLARLVTYGEIALLRNRTYSIPEAPPSSARALLEVRWDSQYVTVGPDGTARELKQQEFRVVSGLLKYREWNYPTRPRHLTWWSTVPGRVVYVPPRVSKNRLNTFRAMFESPLSARDSTWHRAEVVVEMGSWFRMARASGNGGPTRGAVSKSVLESEWTGLPSQSSRHGYRFSPDAYLRLQVVLPEHFPVGRVGCHVRFMIDDSRFDPQEEARVAELSKDPSSLDGLRRYGRMLVLSVPQPLLDRRYEIDWGLPSIATRSRPRAATRRPPRDPTAARGGLRRASVRSAGPTR